MGLPFFPRLREGEALEKNFLVSLKERGRQRVPPSCSALRKGFLQEDFYSQYKNSFFCRIELSAQIKS